MRSFKHNKIIAVLLAASFAIVQPSVYAQAEANKNDVNFAGGSDEYCALADMGFLCDDFPEANSQSFVTRADFAASLVKLCGAAVTVHNANNIPFIDINADSKHADEICTLFDMGIINGTSDRLFSPDEAVTYVQALKLCEDILGYREYTNARYGGYPNGYLLMAGRLGIDEGLSYSADRPLTPGAAALLLYNTARTAVLEADAYNGSGEVTYKSDERKELLAYAHDVYYDEGIMQDNAVVSITDGSQNSGKAVIDGVAYNAGDFDMMSLIGCKIKFFYKDANGSKTLLWAAAADDCTVVTLRSGDLALNDPKYSSTNIVYYDGGKNRNLSVSKYASIVYNNKLTNNYVPIAPKTGLVHFVDNDNDGKYDVVIVEEFSTLVVVSVSVTGNFIAGKYNNSLKLDDYDKVTIYKDKKKAALDDIGGNCTVSYIKDSNNKNIYIYVNSKGKNDELISLSDDDEYTISFADGDYKLNAEYADLRSSGNYHFDDLKIGGKYTYFLDMAGDIAELTSSDNGGCEYAYLVDIARHDKVFEDAAADVKLVLTDGTKLTATTAKKLTLDGVADKSGIDLLSDARVVDNGNAVRQVVKVAFDADGMIKEIDIADACSNEYGYDANNFSLDYSGELRFDVESDSIGYKYPYYEDTPLFADFTNLDDDDSVYIVKPTYSLLQNRTVPMKLYDCDYSLKPAVCVMTLDAAEFDDRIVLVDSVRNIIDNDGGEYKKLIGLSFGLEYEIVEMMPNVLSGGIKRGDILHVTSLDNRLVKAELVCRLSDKPEPFRDKTFDKLGSIFGQIYSVGSNGVVTLNPDSMIADYGRLLASSFNGSGGVGDSIQIYDARNDKVKSGKKSDISQICSPDANGDLPDTGSNVMIYIYRRFEYAKDVVIVYY